MGSSDGAETPSVRRLRVEGLVRSLNSLPLRSDLPAEEANSAAKQIAAIKLELMRTAWDESEWGDFAVFEAWVDEGGIEPLPQPIRKEAVAFFRAGGAP